MRTGSPWGNFLEAFGDWNRVFQRGLWSIKGLWYRMFEARSEDPEFEYLNIDSAIVQAYWPAARKKAGLKIKRTAARNDQAVVMLTTIILWMR